MRARVGVGGAGSQILLCAHPALCLLLRLLFALPLAEGPGFRISCLFNERKEQKAGGEGVAGGGGRAPGCACSERDLERSLRSAGRGRRASCGLKRARLRPPEQQGARRGSRKAAGKPDRKGARCAGTPCACGAGSRWRDPDPSSETASETANAGFLSPSVCSACAGVPGSALLPLCRGGPWWSPPRSRRNHRQQVAP